MYNTDLPTRAELPSTGKLLRSTLMAAVIAVALLITVVLPAEYAIDPTGAGRLLGLTEMGEIKTQLAEEAELDQANEEAAAVQASPSATPQESASDNQPTAAQQASDVEPEQVASLVPDQEMVQPEASVALAEALAAEEAASQATEEAATWGDEVSFTLTPGEGTEYKLTMEEGAVATFAWVSDGGHLISTPTVTEMATRSAMRKDAVCPKMRENWKLRSQVTTVGSFVIAMITT